MRLLSHTMVTDHGGKAFQCNVRGHAHTHTHTHHITLQDAEPTHITLQDAEPTTQYAHSKGVLWQGYEYVIIHAG